MMQPKKEKSVRKRPRRHLDLQLEAVLCAPTLDHPRLRDVVADICGRVSAADSAPRPPKELIAALEELEENQGTLSQDSSDVLALSSAMRDLVDAIVLIPNLDLYSRFRT